MLNITYFPKAAWNQMKRVFGNAENRKQVIHKSLRFNLGSIFIALFAFTIVNTGCNKDNNPTDQSYQQVNLVADAASYNATRIDANLSNPWGIAIAPTGALWIASNRKGLSTVYDGNGAQLLSPVTIPSGAPTGVVYNNTVDFVIPATNEISKFIFAGENGTISAWSSGIAAFTVANVASDDVYKGIAIAKDGSDNFIYVANFKGNNIDVYDKSFNPVTTKAFDDATMPAGFAPFNIYAYDDKLYVTYAKLKSPDNQDDQSGAGNGYVNIFNTDGSLVKRFASQGTLNSPWALAAAPTGFGLGRNRILVGNFGDGRINVFDSDGKYEGQLLNNGTPVAIEGLWALTFPENNNTEGSSNQLFFTAGPNAENNGLFGYLKLQ